ncbi:MAG TPA: HXXEE domain-containing protein [Gemmatimonadales bacterium]|nr:HXXEE domain-containing protein [Gemmatimonadales bacterium]
MNRLAALLLGAGTSALAPPGEVGVARVLGAVGSGRFGLAWLALCVALAIHVADEALNGFLAVYNPTVRAIRTRLPLLPLPTFTFRAWLTGLIVATVILLALTPSAFRGAAWLVPVAYAFGIVMTGNGVGHLVAAALARRAVPGVYSAPLILAAAIYLLRSVR